MKYFDAHAHLQLPQFDADRERVLARMQERGVGAIMVGVDLATSRAAVALAAQHDFLWAAVGLHPSDNRAERFDAEGFAELAAHPKVVAIGECGLDYYRQAPTEEERATQRDRFVRQLALSAAARKPLIVHCRPTRGTQNAHEDMLELLARHGREHGGVRAVIHFFTSTKDIAERYLALGCYLSFPGPITFTDMYDESVRATPLEKILSETDSPFAAPAPYRGTRNEPGYVAEVVHKLAALKNETAERMAVHTVANARRVFSI